MLEKLLLDWQNVDIFVKDERKISGSLRAKHFGASSGD